MSTKSLLLSCVLVGAMLITDVSGCRAFQFSSNEMDRAVYTVAQDVTANCCNSVGGVTSFDKGLGLSMCSVPQGKNPTEWHNSWAKCAKTFTEKSCGGTLVIPNSNDPTVANGPRVPDSQYFAAACRKEGGGIVQDSTKYCCYGQGQSMIYSDKCGQCAIPSKYSAAYDGCCKNAKLASVMYKTFDAAPTFQQCSPITA
ncbi:hypothetical protein SeMB42_g02360 [Synchytrium endobioticum]|uniref:Uncharacterized protein n=1 Tax=Synchytrium endobioticum TaxID=286115 RepID=A0A507DEV5_9FUNG|nr:hypothetical protein SeMB42_g02360 [Synchytrium endobioticum]